MSKRKGLGLGTVIGIGGLLALGGIALAKGSGGSSGDEPGGGGFGGGGSGGGGSGGGGSGGGGSDDPWTPGPGGNGQIYGSGGDPSPDWLPADFDFNGNGLWISPDCTGVIEGQAFRPDPNADWVSAIEPTEWDGYQPNQGQEVEAVLAVAPDNSIAGFVDWAMGHEIPDPPPAFAAWVNVHMKSALRPPASSTAIRLVAEILAQISPICVGMPNLEEQWGEGLMEWFEDFILWIDLYLHEWWQDDIEFDPEPA